MVLVRTEEATVVGLQEKGGGRLEGAKVGNACNEDAIIIGSWLRDGVECAWVWSLAKGWLGACWGAISSGVWFDGDWRRHKNIKIIKEEPQKMLEGTGHDYSRQKRQRSQVQTNNVSKSENTTTPLFQRSLTSHMDSPCNSIVAYNEIFLTVEEMEPS